MRMSHGIWIVLGVLAGLVPAGWGQEDKTSTAVPSYGPIYQDNSSSTQADIGHDVDVIVPDNHPLSGVQELTLGSSEAFRNYLWPSFQLRELADSNPTFGSRSHYGSLTEVTGSLALRRQSSTNELDMQYNGSGLFYTGSGRSLNSQFHDLFAGQTISFRRWTLFLSDAFDYAPESPFGYLGAGGGGVFGAGGPELGLNPAFLPSQGVVTNRATRIGNSVIGQVDYHLSPRSSITASGSYGLLRFLDRGLSTKNELISNNQVVASSGYNYNLNRYDVVAISYTYSSFRYPGLSTSSVRTHSPQLSYGRRVAGRLSLHLSGGPDIVRFDNSQPGSASLGHRSFRWNAQSGLHYARHKIDFGLSYTHFVTGGSGALTGATSDQASISAASPLGRTWQTSLMLGYARNSSLRGAGAFNSGYGGVNLHHNLKRSVGMNFSYNLQRQTTELVCGVGGCGTGFMRHIFGFGFDWHLRPIPLEVGGARSPGK